MFLANIQERFPFPQYVFLYNCFQPPSLASCLLQTFYDLITEINKISLIPISAQGFLSLPSEALCTSVEDDCFSSSNILPRHLFQGVLQSSLLCSEFILFVQGLCFFVCLFFLQFHARPQLQAKAILKIKNNKKGKLQGFYLSKVILLY